MRNPGEHHSQQIGGMAGAGGVEAMRWSAVGMVLAAVWGVLVPKPSLGVNQFPPSQRATAAAVEQCVTSGRWNEVQGFYSLIGSFRHPIHPNDYADVLSLLAAHAGNDFLYGKALTGIRVCFKYGADPNALNGLPLYTAAKFDKWQKITARLLFFGADPNLESKGPRHPYPQKPLGTPLSAAIEWKKPKNVELLLRHRANPNLASREDKRLPLSEAAQTGQVEIMKMLIKAGAQVNAANRFTKRTALHEAAIANQPGAIQELLKSKADKKLKDKNGKTALQLARANRATAAIRALGG